MKEINKNAIETAYSFFHQKERVYAHSTMEWQKDDIEYAISSYVQDMDKTLYDLLSDGQDGFLKSVEPIKVTLLWNICHKTHTYSCRASTCF